ncbi:MAG: hypothetical protein WD770_03055 [Actinomycetota bacterium]
MIRSLLLLLTAASVLVPQPAGAKQATHFHMTGTLQGSGTLDPTCNGFRYATAGPFDGTPLGPVHWTGSECVDALSSLGGFTIWGGFSLNEGAFTGTYRGHAGLPDAAGRIRGWGKFSMTGGTGKYAGVTASGIFTVVAQPVASTADLELIGTLERVSRRRPG